MTDLFLWRGLLYGETAESIFPAKSFYEKRSFGENETSAEKEIETLNGNHVTEKLIKLP